MSNKNLRNLLQTLASDLPREVVRQEGNKIWLDLTLVASDMPRFWALSARADDHRLPLDEALALYAHLDVLHRGELLAGCGYPWPDLRGEDGLTPREAYRARLTGLTRLLAERCLAEGLRESPLMAHTTTLEIMTLMDTIREEIGVVYAPS